MSIYTNGLDVSCVTVYFGELMVLKPILYPGDQLRSVVFGTYRHDNHLFH